VYVIWNRTVQGDIKGRGDGAMEDGKFKRGGAKKEGLLDQATDVERDGDLDSDDEGMDDVSGWKLLHADVFRVPEFSGLLAPLIGSGMQLLFMTTGLLLLSCLGILNPSFRGGFVSVGMGLFIFAGLFSGYFSGSLYKTFGGVSWRKNTLIVGAPFPFRPLFSTHMWLDCTAIPRVNVLSCLHLESVCLGASV
jgi:transmembrane 9 superfamily protein 2/4